jgi:hypothetical protein
MIDLLTFAGRMKYTISKLKIHGICLFAGKQILLKNSSFANEIEMEFEMLIRIFCIFR